MMNTTEKQILADSRVIFDKTGNILSYSKEESNLFKWHLYVDGKKQISYTTAEAKAFTKGFLI